MTILDRSFYVTFLAQWPEVAEQIIEIAKAHNIPVKEDRELVEFLSMLDLYQEVPPDLYKAVAEILAFVYSLHRKS